MIKGLAFGGAVSVLLWWGLYSLAFGQTLYGVDGEPLGEIVRVHTETHVCVVPTLEGLDYFCLTTERPLAVQEQGLRVLPSEGNPSESVSGSLELLESEADDE